MRNILQWKNSILTSSSLDVLQVHCLCPYNSGGLCSLELLLVFEYRLFKDYIASLTKYLPWSYFWVLRIYLINRISISKLLKNSKKMKTWKISIKQQCRLFLLCKIYHKSVAPLNLLKYWHFVPPLFHPCLLHRSITLLYNKFT